MKNLTEDEKAKLYKEVYPIALRFRSSFIGNQEIIKDTFKTIEQLGFSVIKVSGGRRRYFFRRITPIQREKLEKKTLAVQGDLQLIRATNFLI